MSRSTQANKSLDNLLFGVRLAMEELSDGVKKMSKPSGLHKKLLAMPAGKPTLTNMIMTKNQKENSKFRLNSQPESELIILEQQETIFLLRKLQDELVVDQRKVIQHYKEQENVVIEQQKVIELQQQCVAEQQKVIEQQQRQLQEQQRQLEEMKLLQQFIEAKDKNQKRVTFQTDNHDDDNNNTTPQAASFKVANANKLADGDISACGSKVIRLALAA